MFTYIAGSLGMMALGRENMDNQNRIAQQGGIQPLVRLLRSPKTTEFVLLTVIETMGTLCIGMLIVTFYLIWILLSELNMLYLIFAVIELKLTIQK